MLEFLYNTTLEINSTMNLSEQTPANSVSFSAQEYNYYNLFA